MKKFAVSNLLRRAAALTLAAVLAVPTVYADAGEEKLQTVSQLVDGLTYRNTITENYSSRVESFSMELEEGAGARPILLQSAGTVYGAATINKAVSRAQELGYHVLGAINTDFFATATGVPIGIVIEDGVYKSGAEKESAMTIADGEVELVERPVVSMTLTNQRTGQAVAPHHFNKLRSASGGLYLLNQDFSAVSTRTTGPGWFVRMKVVESGDESLLTVNSNLTLEVTELLRTEEPTAIGPGEYLLTADDGSGYPHIFESFQVGDEVKLSTACEDEVLSSAQWAGGVGDVMVRDGALTDSGQWTYMKDGKAPRTALGLRKDGTLVVYAVDGRKAGYSAGLSQLDLADEMLARDCQWAVNLDGGGSTAISVWVPGQEGPTVRNLPSDGKARSCATYLVLVADEPGDGKPDRLALKEDGLTVLTGTSLPLPKGVALDNGLNVLDETMDDLTITSRKDLGEIKGDLYLAGDKAGTDTLRLRSRDLDVEGDAQIHVVDRLTALNLSKAGSATALTTLVVKPGEEVQLAASGSYWNRTALRGAGGVKWTVEGGVGSVDRDGLFTASKKGGSGTITAEAGGISTTIKVSMTNVHDDVTEGHWAYEAVEYCYQKGIVGGVSPTEFGRDQQIRRADFMLMLYKAVGSPKVNAGCDFTDVSEDDYYYKALSWGQSVGLASGTGNGAYSPKAPVTREQAFTILRQAMPVLGKECPTGSIAVLDQFSDKDLIADYAKGHTATLVAQGVVSGKGSGIDPRGNLTRAEMAALLYKIITYTPILDVPTDPVEPVEPEQPTDPVEPELPDPSQYTLTLDTEEITLGSGESAALKAALEPAIEGAEITWTSSAPSAAAVSAKGVVTNLFAGVGSPAVTITASWNGLTASCTVNCEQAELTGTVVNAEQGLNVRSGPGTDSAVVGGLSDGAHVVVLGVENGWCHVLYLNRAKQAAIGYVSADYIALSH